MQPLIILPFVDALELTDAALRSAIAQTTEPTILLIDNGSRQVEASRAWTESRQTFYGSRVLVWRYHPPFPSLAGMWNRALQYAWEAGHETALVVNNDVRLGPTTHQVLLEVQATTDAYVVTGVECKDQRMWEAAQGAEVWDAAAHLPLTTLGGPSLSCYLMSKAGHEKYPFDNGFVPAYAEDIDWHRRVLLGGDGVRAFGLNLPFWHHGSATINQSPELAAIYARRIEQGSRTYFRAKWGGPCNEEVFTVPFDASSAQPEMTTPLLFERARYLR